LSPGMVCAAVPAISGGMRVFFRGRMPPSGP
jgi:hypothetical protein